MPPEANNETLVCEQCGAPLQSRDGENECLNCLLTAGLQSGKAQTNSEPNEPDERFYQHYEILSRPDGTRWELGRGAMGVTYKARDVNLDTPVALKIINARFSSQPGARQRFLHEAQAAARLRHPNVASVFHFGAINTLPAGSDAVASPEEQAEAGVRGVEPDGGPGRPVPGAAAPDDQRLPPAIAGRITTVSPSDTLVSRPSSTRTSSSFR